MDKDLQLSIFLPFQNKRDAVEPTLTALFELSEINFELFIIDDASTDGTGQAVQSLLDYYEHEHTFFFEHNKPLGRGNSLNELLPQANTDVVWMPHSLESIDESALADALEKLESEDCTCLIQQFSIPAENNQWLEMIRDKPFPADGQFLWNIEQITSTQHFLNPHLKRFHSLEWLLRTGSKNAETLKSIFYEPSEFEDTAAATAFERQELTTTLLRRTDISSKIHRNLVELLHELPAITSPQTDVEAEHELLERAQTLKNEGQLSAALELVETLLQKEPGNTAAKYLKVEILERNRRYVEASELKHELQADSKIKPVHAKLGFQDIKTSLIIPTALYGKGALEHCLLSVTDFCNPATTELIIIDNASLDDTFDYLKELKQKNFFNCKVITNPQNKGFAASINQGFEVTNGDYCCIIHNDVEFESAVVTRLEQLMDENPDYALVGPLTDSTLNPDQLISNQDENYGPIVETDYLDSFCMMVRTNIVPRLDEQYTLAFFDDIDFSFQVREAGHKVGIATEIAVTHHYGNTTLALDLDTESELYWKNIAHFNEKWDIGSFSEEQLQGIEELDQLLMLDEWVNPLYPEPVIKNKFEELFTSELKTKILKSDHGQDVLQRFVHLFMVMEERETMRRLEDRLTKPELPVTLIYEIARFYFKKNIYSRCLHYLDRLASQQETLQSELYRLAILIDEKKMEQAIPKLTALLEKAPSNPFLYKLAGDIYTFQNDDEAESFYRLAEQINPFDFSRQPEKTKVNKT